MTSRRSIIGGSTVRELEDHVNPDGFRVGLTRQEVQRTERMTANHHGAPTSSKGILTEVEEALLDVMRRRSVVSDEDDEIVVGMEPTSPLNKSGPKPPRPSASGNIATNNANTGDEYASPPELFLSDFNRNTVAEIVPLSLGTPDALSINPVPTAPQPPSRQQQQQQLLTTFSNASNLSVAASSFGGSNVVFDRTFDTQTYVRSAVTGRVREGPSQPQSLTSLECDEMVELLMFCTDLFKHDLFTLLELFSTPFEETSAVDRFSKKWEHVLSALTTELFPVASHPSAAENDIQIPLVTVSNVDSQLARSKNMSSSSSIKKSAAEGVSATTGAPAKGAKKGSVSPIAGAVVATFSSKLLGRVRNSGLESGSPSNISLSLGGVDRTMTATKAKEIHSKFSFLEGLKGMLRSTFQYTFEEVALRHQEKNQSSFSHKSYNDAMFSAIGKSTKANQHSHKMEAQNKLLTAQLEAAQKEVLQLKDQRDTNTQQYYKELMQVRQKMMDLQRQVGDNTKVAELLEHPTRMRSSSVEEQNGDDDTDMNVEQHLRYVNKKLTVECAVLNHTLVQRDHVLKGLERELEQSRAAVAKAKILAAEALLKDEAVDATLEEATQLMLIIDELKAKIEMLEAEKETHDATVKDAERQMMTANANFAMLEQAMESQKTESLETEAQLKCELGILAQKLEDIQVEHKSNFESVEAQLAKQRRLLTEERRDHQDEIEQNFKQLEGISAELEKVKSQLIEDKQASIRDIAAKDVLIAERDLLIVKLQQDVDQLSDVGGGGGNLQFFGDDSRPASATIGRRTASLHSTNTDATTAEQALRERNEHEKIAYAKEQSTMLLAALNDLEVEHHSLQNSYDLDKAKWAAAESQHTMERRHLETELDGVRSHVKELEAIIAKQGEGASKDLADANRRNKEELYGMRRRFDDQKADLEDENDLQMKGLLASKRANAKSGASDRMQRLSIQAEARLSPFGAFLPMEHSGRNKIPRPLSGSLTGGSPRASYRGTNFSGEGSLSRGDSEVGTPKQNAKGDGETIFLSTNAFTGGSASSHQPVSANAATNTDDFEEYLLDISDNLDFGSVVRTQSISSNQPKKNKSSPSSKSKNGRLKQLAAVAGGTGGAGGGGSNGDAYLIAQLRQEVERLRKLLSAGNQSRGGEVSRQSSIKSHQNLGGSSRAAANNDAAGGHNNSISFQQPSPAKRNSSIAASSNQRRSNTIVSIPNINGIGNMSPLSPGLPIPGGHPQMDAPILITSMQQTASSAARNPSIIKPTQVESPISGDVSRSVSPSFPLTSVQTQLFNQPLTMGTALHGEESLQVSEAQRALQAVMASHSQEPQHSQNQAGLELDSHPDVPVLDTTIERRAVRASSPKGPRGSSSTQKDIPPESNLKAATATVSRGEGPPSQYLATVGLTDDHQTTSPSVSIDGGLNPLGARGSTSTTVFTTVRPMQLQAQVRRVGSMDGPLSHSTDDVISNNAVPLTFKTDKFSIQATAVGLTPQDPKPMYVKATLPRSGGYGGSTTQSQPRGGPQLSSVTPPRALQTTTAATPSTHSRPHSATISKLHLIPSTRPGSSAASRLQSATNASTVTTEFPGLECAAEHYDLFECVAKLKFAMNELIAVCEADTLARQQQAAGDPEAVATEDTEQFVRNQMLSKFNIFRSLDNFSVNLLNKLDKKKENILRRREDQLEGVLGALQNISLTHPKEAKVLRGKLNGRRSEGSVGEGPTRVPLPMTQMELLARPRPSSALDISHGNSRALLGNRSMTPTQVKKRMAQ